MTHDPARRSVLALGAAALGLAFAPTAARAGPLDRYSDEQVQEWLEDELEDLYEDFQEYGFYANEVLEEAVMAMLSDNPPHASQKHVAAHRFLTQAALDAEMREARTTLRAVVHAAVLEADAMAFMQPSRARVITAAWRPGRQPDSDLAPAGLLLAQAGRGDGRGQPHNLLITASRGIVRAKARA